MSLSLEHQIGVNRVLILLCDLEHMDEATLTGRSRAGRTVQARRTAVWVLRAATPLTLARIGIIFGGRSHATIHAIANGVAQEAASSPAVARRLSMLTEKAREAFYGGAA